MAKTKLNIGLFKKIRERIATIPASYDQSDWVTTSNSAPCGAAACLAGEAIICAAPTVQEGLKELRRLNKRKDRNAVIPARAAKLLGLEGSWGDYCETQNQQQGRETLIFDADARFWPSDLREQFQDGEEADAAVELLDKIIETGKVPIDY